MTARLAIDFLEDRPDPALHRLGGLAFGAAGDPSLLAVGARQLAPAAPGAATIACTGQIREGTHGRVRYRATEALLFGRIEVSAADEGGDAMPLERTTETAYRALFASLEALGYPVLARVWNYFPEINAETEGLERYRRFNAGRQAAFAACGRALGGAVPAACALGTPDGPLAIAFLAARTGYIAVENPRQVSAYDYPPEYGPSSPTFARAGVLGLPGGGLLLVSGTAAIVGHRSRHAGDVEAQTRETVANLAALVAEANRAAAPARFDPRDLDYIVYLRRAADLAAVQVQLAEQLPTRGRRLFVEADICRADLLIEIEAWGAAGDAR